MIPFEAVRAAVLADQPWSRLDDLVRAELAGGRTVIDIFEELNAMANQVLDIPGLTEDGEDAFGDTLDALTGNCPRDGQYHDLPRPATAAIPAPPPDRLPEPRG
jgi:hypothetical protein